MKNIERNTQNSVFIFAGGHKDFYFEKTNHH